VLNETYNIVRTGKHLSDNFAIQNGLKVGDALSPFVFNFALEYAIRKVQEDQVGLELNETHQLLVYIDVVSLQGDNIDIIKRNTQTLIDASKGFGLEVNTAKTKYMLLSRHQNAGKINRNFENVAWLRYLGTTIRNQNLIQEEIKRRLISGNAYYHYGQSPLSFRLPCKCLKIRTYEIIILPVVLYGCEPCSLTLREERRLRVFENRVLRRIFGPKR
jgi:hypothetical protein